MGWTDRLLCASVVIHSLSNGGTGMETKMLLSPLNKLEALGQWFSLWGSWVMTSCVWRGGGSNDPFLGVT